MAVGWEGWEGWEKADSWPGLAERQRREEMKSRFEDTFSEKRADTI